MNTPRLAVLIFAASTVVAQVPDAPFPAVQPTPTRANGSAPVGQSAPQNGNGNGAPAAQKSPFGNDVPVFDPGTEVVSFNGKNWNIANNRIFQARFEKFLNAPEATAKEDLEYRHIVETILTLLAPGNATRQNTDAAFKALSLAGRYDIDAHLCDSLADAVYAVWQAQRNQNSLAKANAAMEEELRQLESNLKIATDGRGLQTSSNGRTTGRSNAGGPGGGNNQAAPQGGGQVNPANSTDYDTFSYTRRHADRLLAIKGNQVKRELSELEAKVGFHTLMVQFLAQRRFQHVVMATRFYRALFTDGDTKLNLGKDMTEAIQRSTGMPPTVSIIDSLANEAMRDVREGTKAFEFLLTQNEMQGATMRLQEVFLMGEYMPDVRLIMREKKRRCLEFSQKSFQLISAIDVRDYGRAEQLVKDLKKVANDFDDTKPTAAIEGVRLKARGLLVKARQAAINNNQPEVEKAMNEAGELWPGNPEFKEASEKLYTQSDTVQRALTEFDDLVRQKNLRQIWKDKLRFTAAVALNPERKDALEKVMKDMESIETALREAAVRARQSDHAGAWETLEKEWHSFPDDPVLNQQRADFTTRASEFVKTIRSAEDLEKRDQYGSSLAHFLKAQRLYPASEFAKDGVDRLVKKIVPEG